MKFSSIITCAIIFFIINFNFLNSRNYIAGKIVSINKKSNQVLVKHSSRSPFRIGQYIKAQSGNKIITLKVVFPMMTMSRCKVVHPAWWHVRYLMKNQYVYFRLNIKPVIKPVVKKTGWKIGDKGPGGGFVFYDKGNNSGGWRFLEAAPVDQSTGIQWFNTKNVLTSTSNTSLTSGRSNTNRIIRIQQYGNYAAVVCTQYRGGGKKDWFMPSRDQLSLMYFNLQKKGIGNFYEGNYWSSSEINAYNAWLIYFGSGIQDGGVKSALNRVRAVRAF